MIKNSLQVDELTGGQGSKLGVLIDMVTGEQVRGVTGKLTS